MRSLVVQEFLVECCGPHVKYHIAPSGFEWSQHGDVLSNFHIWLRNVIEAFSYIHFETHISPQDLVH
jgi:hypothetical protein